MIWVYVICVVVSVGICYWYFAADVRRSVVQNIMLLVMLAGNLGYLSLAASRELGAALLAIKIVYISACFLSVLYFLTICEVCRVKLKKWLVVAMISVQSVIYLLACSIGYNDIFYTNTSFEKINGVGILVKDYGPTHILSPITIFFYFILAIIVAIYTCAKKKNVNRKELICIIACSCVVVGGYAIERIIGSKYEFIPFFYIVLMIGALIPIYNSDIFTVTENMEVIDEQLENIGFVTFDKSLCYMGANKKAYALFPELKTAEVGYRLENPSEDISKVIEEAREFLSSVSNVKHQHTKKREYVIDGRTYETKIHTLENFIGHRVGITMEFRDITEHARIIEFTNKYNEELNEEVRKKTERISKIQEKTILGMAQMVESRDLSTGGHIKRTSKVVRIFSDRLLSKDMGFTKQFLNLVIRSAPMHDLGKIGVDDAILRKQGLFEPDEYEKMKKHAEIGGRMVKEILTNVEEEDFVNVAYNVANYHHEKVNGKGYPEGLKGDQIPVEARIMALADVFDALVSKRCYKNAFSYDEAFDIIRKDAGEHFDATLAAVFLECRPELERYYDKEKALE